MLQTNDLHMVRDLTPDIAIFEMGTNEFSKFPPETVGSAIEDLMCLLQSDFF